MELVQKDAKGTELFNSNSEKRFQLVTSSKCRAANCSNEIKAENVISVFGLSFKISIKCSLWEKVTVSVAVLVLRRCFSCFSKILS